MEVITALNMFRNSPLEEAVVPVSFEVRDGDQEIIEKATEIIDWRAMDVACHKIPTLTELRFEITLSNPWGCSMYAMYAMYRDIIDKAWNKGSRVSGRMRGMLRWEIKAEGLSSA